MMDLKALFLSEKFKQMMDNDIDKLGRELHQEVTAEDREVLKVLYMAAYTRAKYGIFAVNK